MGRSVHQFHKVICAFAALGSLQLHACRICIAISTIAQRSGADLTGRRRLRQWARSVYREHRPDRERRAERETRSRDSSRGTMSNDRSLEHLADNLPHDVCRLTTRNYWSANTISFLSWLTPQPPHSRTARSPARVRLSLLHLVARRYRTSEVRLCARSIYVSPNVGGGFGRRRAANSCERRRPRRELAGLAEALFFGGTPPPSVTGCRRASEPARAASD